MTSDSSATGHTGNSHAGHSGDSLQVDRKENERICLTAPACSAQSSFLNQFRYLLIFDSLDFSIFIHVVRNQGEVCLY